MGADGPDNVGNALQALVARLCRALGADVVADAALARARALSRADGIALLQDYVRGFGAASASDPAAGAASDPGPVSDPALGSASATSRA